MDVAMLYVTCPDMASARRLARGLLDAGRVACANTTPIQSLYVDEGVLHDEPEVLLILKTRASIAREVMAEAAELHPYETPCVVVYEAVAAHPAYAEWVGRQTTPSADAQRARPHPDGASS